MSDIATKLTTIAENQQKVYDAGYEKGKAEGGGGNTARAYQQGFSDGKQAERDLFWDTYQQNGSRTAYSRAFASKYWSDDTFFPKYHMWAISIDYAFQGSTITDLKGKLDAQGVILDTASCKTFTSIFQGSKITHIPQIDMEQATMSTNAFNQAEAITIDKLIVSETTVLGNIFAKALQNITFEGTIGKSISFQNSLNLTLASAKSILTHLKNFTGTGKEHSTIVTLHANTWALLDDDGNTAPDGSTWREYVQSTLCWNI